MAEMTDAELAAFARNLAEYLGSFEHCEPETPANLLAIAARLERPAVAPAEFAERMREIAGIIGDPEMTHPQGDSLMVEVLRSLGYGEGCDAFASMPKWYA